MVIILDHDQSQFVISILVAELDKATRPNISKVVWILSSNTICQLNQLFSNSEAKTLSMQNMKDIPTLSRQTL